MGKFTQNRNVDAFHKFVKLLIHERRMKTYKEIWYANLNGCLFEDTEGFPPNRLFA